jgi:hypothetical protein
LTIRVELEEDPSVCGIDRHVYCSEPESISSRQRQDLCTNGMWQFDARVCNVAHVVSPDVEALRAALFRAFKRNRGNAAIDNAKADIGHFVDAFLEQGWDEREIRMIPPP